LFSPQVATPYCRESSPYDSHFHRKILKDFYDFDYEKCPAANKLSPLPSKKNKKQILSVYTVEPLNIKDEASTTNF
jgi:hypothetical protein